VRGNTVFSDRRLKISTKSRVIQGNLNAVEI
jgi:hypothetical protein